MRKRFNYNSILSLSLLSLAFAINNLGHAQVWQEWVKTYNGPGNGADSAVALVVDGNGYVYVTGCSDATPGSVVDYDYATIKYNSTGDTMWSRRYAYPVTNSTDKPTDMAVDALGNVCVTGFVGGPGGNPPGTNWATVKYNSGGTQQWVAELAGDYNDWPNAMALYGNDYIYVTGYIQVGGSYNLAYETVKYNSYGGALWDTTFGVNSWNNVATDIAVNSIGDVYVTGNAGPSVAHGYDFATIKYSYTGQWMEYYNGPANRDDWARALVLDNNGNVCVTGESSEGIGIHSDYATVSYTPSGTERWSATYDGPGHGIDVATAIAADAVGNLYVTGYSEGLAGIGTNYDYATIKYNAFGDTMWVRRYDGPGNSEDKATAIALDQNGNIYVTGYSDGDTSSITNFDYATVKYNSLGDEIWVVRYNGLGNGNDEAHAIGVDNVGNVFVTGSSWGNGTDVDYATIKYGQINVDISFITATDSILIPPQGGSFSYNITVRNNSDSAAVCDVWCDVTLPNGSPYGPVLGPVNLRLPPWFSGNRNRTQDVPGIAPTGNYMFNGYVGIYPNVIWDKDSFPFTKLATGNGKLISEWSNQGQDFDELILR